MVVAPGLVERVHPGMTRTMADACSASNLPPGHDLYGTYVDGGCEVADGTAVRISSLATNAGNTGDCEPHNPGWSYWINWVEERRAAGVIPTVYCMDDGYGDDSTWSGWRHADGVSAFSAAGVAQPQWWVCRPGASEIPSYAVAVQTGLDIPPGYDISLVADYVPGWDPTPQEMTTDMFFMQFTGLPLQLVCSCPAVGLTGQPKVSSNGGVPVLTMANATDYEAVLTASAKLETQGGPSIAGSGSITGSFTLS